MSEEQEEWRPVVGYEGLYEVSNLGRVRLLRSNRIAKLTKQDDRHGGYMVVTLIKYEGSKRLARTGRIHRLVAEAFIPNPENKPCIDHINTDPTDNRVENLRWSTYLENNRNPITWERHLAAHRTQEYHDKMTSAKQQAMYKSAEHRQRCREGSRWHMRPIICVETGEVWESAQEAARQTGLNTSTILAICKRYGNPNYKPQMISPKTGKPVLHFKYYLPTNNQGEGT